MNDINKFKQFLRDNDAAAKYYNNCYLLGNDYGIKSVDEDLKHTQERFGAHHFISGAFSWGRAIEGEDFWLNLHRKWRDVLLQ